MEKLASIMKCLMECHYVFPDYSRKTDDIEIIADIFSRHLAHVSTSAIISAFHYHIANGKDFPRVSDILDATNPTVVYRMDYGPKGFDSLYHEEHPYVRLQVKLGQNVAQYAETVSKVQSDTLRNEAHTSPTIEFEEDDKPEIEPRRYYGFRQISFSKIDGDE